ncbi:methionine aminopeptidase [Nocardiopsis gilva YIM 90087]|uniref:Methionine aminopeptidase n=1 Tax=Nocardiopsis gilva YIM 90087 TaxID=1235441 RepID=A0A223S1I4_9ACTN|nr:type I methionyl aminopeptidase [Nocardiopsis gilva]ASU81964.1 methionine aminopeptidase [Nocardiopsis gilva YIM 90087]
MVELKTPSEIEAMREAGRIVAQALDAVREHAAPGVPMAELDALARRVITDAGAEPLFLGYHPDWAPTPFPGTICASVNDAVVHGVPNGGRLRDGDVVSIDCGARLRGWCGDAAITFTVGRGDPADTALIAETERALSAGIEAARPGATLGDVSAAIGHVTRDAGYGAVADHGGHGIGRTMHEAPFVSNDGRGGRGMRLRPGLVLALEPMLTRGSGAYRTDADGWTVRTLDGSRAAHSEHTVAVTEDGPMVLTVP